MSKLDAVVEKYITLRNEKKELETRHKEELKPYNEKMEKIENVLLASLDQLGADNVSTPHGTAYKSHRTSAKIQDWEVALDYIVDNNLWSMLERRVSKTAVEEFIVANGAPPPGVSISVERTLNIRAK